jgi:hypothetical protein
MGQSISFSNNYPCYIPTQNSLRYQHQQQQQHQQHQKQQQQQQHQQQQQPSQNNQLYHQPIYQHYNNTHQCYQAGPINNGMSTKEYNMIKSYFFTIAGIDEKLDRQEFAILIAKLYPQLAGQNLHQVSGRAFASIDVNGDGYISLEEFLAAYMNMKGKQLAC